MLCKAALISKLLVVNLIVVQKKISTYLWNLNLNFFLTFEFSKLYKLIHIKIIICTVLECCWKIFIQGSKDTFGKVNCVGKSVVIAYISIAWLSWAHHIQNEKEMKTKIIKYAWVECCDHLTLSFSPCSSSLFKAVVEHI